ncbi:ABC transporter permease [Rhodococcus sp. NPDC060176]|uniref:ABC transporter permease n=1 Tax=Rhodococcus sp. NPDC060176 TaxID=3347062 RepID=UPI0036550D03
MSIFRFALRRLMLAVPTLLGLLVATFALANFLPGDSMGRLLGDKAASNPEIVANYRHLWGLDQPLPIQFLVYLKNLLQGDLGRSTVSQRPVVDDLLDYLPATIELAVAAILVAGTGGLVLGTLAAYFHRRWPDTVVRAIALVASGVPVFWLALISLQIFYLKLGIVPGPEGRLSREFATPTSITGAYTVDALLTGQWGTFVNAVQHLILPALVLGSYFLGLIARITRASTLEVLCAQYVVTARSKGLSPMQVLRSYILPNALIPTVTVLGLAVGGLLSGAVLTETVFAWPGIGRYAVEAAKALDYQAILGVSLVIGVIYVLTNAVVDIVYAKLDPRILLGK